MSAETKDITGEGVTWNLTPVNSERFVNIGRYSFDRTEFNFGIYRFLAGEKEIIVDEEIISIPDDTQGTVTVGRIEMPYEQFVEGVIWTLQQSGKMIEDFQTPWLHSQYVALDALKEKLKQDIPPRNDQRITIAQGLKGVVEFLRVPPFT